MQYDSVHASATTDTNTMVMDYRYSPSNPHNGCPIEIRLSFEQTYDQTQKLSNVQYDIYTVDDNGQQISSLAQTLGRSYLFAPVGDDDNTFVLKGTTPLSHIIISASGTGAEGSSVDSTSAGLVKFDIKTQESLAPATGNVGTSSNPNVISIPSWVKNNAKYWHDGSIDDSTFAQGIQYMIKQGIITIPPTQSGKATPGVTIPAWVKNNAGYWSTGDIDDATFVKGIQFLITSGIIQV
jgi:hypothetical protein